MGGNEPDWNTAKYGIQLLLNDKNKEAEDLFRSSPQNIHMTAGSCYVTFMNALMCFDDAKVSEAIINIKKIEEQCVTQIGWMKTFKNKIFTPQDDVCKSVEQTLEEKIVLADSLVCQSFLTFLHNDFASYMKAGWTLRRAWKVYQHTYEQLSTIHNKIIGPSGTSGFPSCDEMYNRDLEKSPTIISSPSWSISDNEQCTQSHSNNNTSTTNLIKSKKTDDNKTPMLSNIFKIGNHNSSNLNGLTNRNFYSCNSKTVGDFSSNCKDNQNNDLETGLGCESDENSSVKSSSVPQSTHPSIRPDSLDLSCSSNDGTLKKSKRANGNVHQSSMRKSVSLLSSLNSFSSAILESATSLIGFNKESKEDWENIHPDTVRRLMSAVCFGYGIFKLCVSLAPPSILRWANMFGFEGDQSAALSSLNLSRRGEDMRAPLASLALLWYHTIVRPFFNLDGVIVASGVEEATKILEEEREYEDSALFLFFKGRVERLKPNIPGAIEAYQQSVSNASLPDVKLLGLHEVGWCHLLTLDFQQAFECFLQLRHQSKWSKSFYSYLTTITVGATGNTSLVLPGKSEIKFLQEKSANKGAQIEKYIKRRIEKLPEKKDIEKEWVRDKIHWQLYCFEMLYLWNTFPSCRSADLETIITTCTPVDGDQSLPHEPMKGIGWLILGAASLVLGNRLNAAPTSNSNGKTSDDKSSACLTRAVDAFRMCLHVRSKCTDDVHVAAFAQYELAMLLLRNENTRAEGKSFLLKSQSQYKDYDFEHRLNVRINSTLRSIEKYEAQNKFK